MARVVFYMAFDVCIERILHQFFRLFCLSAQPRCLTKLVKTSKTAGLHDRVFFKGLPWEMWAILQFCL